MGELLRQISRFQHLEREKQNLDPTYKRILKAAIVTARNAPAHQRIVCSLNSWGVEVDQAFFLGGIDKSRVLNIMKPHMFFDDQIVHFEYIDQVPCVHIPFGIANQTTVNEPL